MSREENVGIFKDTEKFCKTNQILINAIKESSLNQNLILESKSVQCEKKRYEKLANIIVSKKRTFEAAQNYSGKKIAVLNFASASNPGGGVERGASAQEEALCRCSTLYFNLKENFLWNNFYKNHRNESNPLHNDDIIYTPNVVVFKSDTNFPTLLEEKEWYKVNVITCAAPNLRERPSNIYNSGDGNNSIHISDADLQKLHEKRCKKILDVALSEKNEVIILGAFGCGAFRNKPSVVAKAYSNVIKEYKNAFETIEFAVYCPVSDDTNFQVFSSILG